METFKQLLVWQRAMQLATETYRLSASFPRAEMFGLTQQVRRASVSVSCNIAEGRGRRHRKEYLQFLGIARGSLNEVESLLDLAEMLGFVETVQLARSRELAAETGKLLAGLTRSLS